MPVKINNNIYLLEDSVMMPGGALPARAVFVKTTKGNVLISPTPHTQKYLNFILEQGGVQYLVAPNLFHHINYPKAVALFPKAERWGVRGFNKKRPDIQWEKFFNVDEWPLEEELLTHCLLGCNKVNEVCFVHPESRTLIATDLIFNLKPAKKLLGKIIFNIFGTNGRTAMSRLFVWLGITDRSEFMTSVALLLDEDFERVVMSHGNIIEKNGPQVLREALHERNLA